MITLDSYQSYGVFHLGTMDNLKTNITVMQAIESLILVAFFR